MVKTGQEGPRCAYPGCENEPRPGEPGYCGRPDPVTGEPHTALTAFRRRQALAGQGGGAAGPADLGRPWLAVWRYRRAGVQRRQQAEAAEARLAALQADAQLAEARAAKAAAEQEAAATQEAARARAAEAERAAEERVAAARQDAARAREAAESARAELDCARQAAHRQVAKVREDAARDQAELRAELEARIAAAEEARAALQARAEHAEAELQRARAHRGQTAGQAAPAPPTGPARRRRRSPGNLATSNYSHRTSRSVRARAPTRGSAQPPISAVI